MFTGLEQVILQLGPKLQGQEPDPAGFWEELINYIAANVDAVQADLSPLMNAIRSKVRVEPLPPKKSKVSGSQPSANAQARDKRLKECVDGVLLLKALSIPSHLIPTEFNGRQFWIKPRVGAICEKDTNAICALYNRVTSLKDDAELYHRFGSVAFHQLVLKIAKESNFHRITEARLTRIINNLVDLIALSDKQYSIEQQDSCIRAQLTCLYCNGLKWCQWGEALGGLGSFFYNPHQLTIAMFERINSFDRNRIAVHFKRLGIEKLAQKYNGIAEEIVMCIQMGVPPDQGLERSVEEGLLPLNTINMMVNVGVTGYGSEINDSLSLEATQGTGNLVTPHLLGVWGPTSLTSMADMMQPLKGVPYSLLSSKTDSIPCQYSNFGTVSLYKQLQPLDQHSYPSTYSVSFLSSLETVLSLHTSGPSYPFVENVAENLQECDRVLYANPSLPPSASHPYIAQQDICFGNSNIHGHLHLWDSA